jgi:SAM-dependent methyltransferase
MLPYFLNNIIPGPKGIPGNSFREEEGVLFLSEKKPGFEDSYIEVRKKEKRILSDDDVKHLPFNRGKHASEWRIRRSTAERFCKMVKDLPSQTILEIGCGNGWFSHFASKNTPHCLIGIDINFEELKQAARLFTAPNCMFLYYDITENKLPQSSVDKIVFNSSFQYFKNAMQTIDLCLSLLKPDGRIYILDSPFYSENTIEKARSNTNNYFSTHNNPGMIAYYHHHTFESLAPHKWSDLNSETKRLTDKILRRPTFPFITISR